MLLLLGPPGAGKSVQARLLEKAGLIQWLSVGQLLREKLNGRYSEEIKQGKLIKNEVVNELVATEIDSKPNKPPLLLDGFPRRQSQAKWLHQHLENAGKELTGIIHLKVPEEESVRRLLKRGRTDDVEQTIKERYKQYEEVAVTVLEYFLKKGVPVHNINGEDSIEDIHREITEALIR